MCVSGISILKNVCKTEAASANTLQKVFECKKEIKIKKVYENVIYYVASA